MEFLNIFAIAVSLSMDAFSVSIAAGIVIEKLTVRHYFRLSFHFGLFQFMMPVIGFFAGDFIEQYLSDYSRWIAFGLLVLIGLKMIKEALSKEKDENESPKDPSKGFKLIFLSIATSIDALLVGISLAMLDKPIWTTSIIIGVVCAFFSILGAAIGKKAGKLFGKKVEIVGGVILIGIGIKILIESYVSG